MSTPSREDVEALVEIVESGWEDEPTEAETELARTVAHNVLASDWLAAHVAAARDAGAQRVLDAVEALPGPGNVGIKGWPEHDQECYLLAHEEALSAARAAVSDLRTEPAPEAEVERLRAARLSMERERNHAEVRADQAEAARDRLVAAVEALADEWDGYGHGEFCTHLESQLPCSVCDLLSRLRAVLAEHGSKP